MIDKVVYVLSEGFRKEGLLVPFGTVYRIAEDLIAMQNDCSKELVVCKDCKHCDPENMHCDHPMGTTFPFSRKPYDFCSYGERKDNG